MISYLIIFTDSENAHATKMVKGGLRVGQARKSGPADRGVVRAGQARAGSRKSSSQEIPSAKSRSSNEVMTLWSTAS